MSSVQHAPAATVKSGLKAGKSGATANLPGAEGAPVERPGEQLAQTMKEAVGIFAAVLSPFALATNPGLARQGFGSLSLPERKEEGFGKMKKRLSDEMSIICSPMSRLSSSQLMGKPKLDAAHEHAKLPLLHSRKEGR